MQKPEPEPVENAVENPVKNFPVERSTVNAIGEVQQGLICETEEKEREPADREAVEAEPEPAGMTVTRKMEGDDGETAQTVTVMPHATSAAAVQESAPDDAQNAHVDARGLSPLDAGRTCAAEVSADDAARVRRAQDQESAPDDAQTPVRDTGNVVKFPAKPAGVITGARMDYVGASRNTMATRVRYRLDGGKKEHTEYVKRFSNETFERMLANVEEYEIYKQATIRRWLSSRGVRAATETGRRSGGTVRSPGFGAADAG